jgi:hypothetical protein
MSDTEVKMLWMNVMEVYRPYRLRLESQSMFRDPKDELLPDEVHDDAELSSLICEATLLTERFLLSLQTAEMRLQEIAWRFCAQFYGLEPNQIIKFGALEHSWLQVQRLSVRDYDADLGELCVHGLIVSGDGFVTSRKSWFRLDLVPWWHISV